MGMGVACLIASDRMKLADLLSRIVIYRQFPSRYRSSCKCGNNNFLVFLGLICFPSFSILGRFSISCCTRITAGLNSMNKGMSQLEERGLISHIHVDLRLHYISLYKQQ